METFTAAKALVENPSYQQQRRACLAGLSADMIDRPILRLVSAFNARPYCFTLQCCHGHFVYDDQHDPQNLAPLPAVDPPLSVEYRIAYLAFCIENSAPGRKFLAALQKIPSIDPANIQFGCAQWFWERQFNSYVLQVEPDRFKFQDTAILAGQEALKIENLRNRFFVRLERLLRIKQH